MDHFNTGFNSLFSDAFRVFRTRLASLSVRTVGQGL